MSYAKTTPFLKKSTDHYKKGKEQKILFHYHCLVDSRTTNVSTDLWLILKVTSRGVGDVNE